MGLVMIEYLKGVVTKKKDDLYVINLGFVALKFRSPNMFEGEGTVFIEMFVKDERIELYGFKSSEEREIFNKLLSVNGVGVKHALSILRTFSVDQFLDILENRDITLLTTAPGVGKKTGQRIILELKGKFDFRENELLTDLVDALVEMGFEKKKAVNTVREVLKVTDNVEEALKLALQKINEKG